MQKKISNLRVDLPTVCAENLKNVCTVIDYYVEHSNTKTWFEETK